MNKLIVLGIAATAGAAKLAFFPANPPVDLQPTSPGTAQTGHINVSGTATVGLLKSQGTVFGGSTAPTGFAYGGYFTAASNQGRGFYGYASSPTGLTYGGFFQNASDSGRAVYGLATSTTGFNYGGYFQSASVAGRGLLGVAASPTGTTYGVYGTAVSPNGYGVYSEGRMHATGVISGNGSGIYNVDAATFDGYNYTDFYRKTNPVVVDGTYSEAIRGETNYNAGKGVMGTATSTSGNTYGVYGLNASAGGKGVLGSASSTSGNCDGVYGQSASTGGRGVVGWAFATTGGTIGVYGRTDSTSGKGVYGNATATSGNTRGVVAYNASTSGWAMEARATATSGETFGLISYTSSPTSQAILAHAKAATGTSFGVQGAVNSPNGWGVWSFGRLGASGTKSFRIDHPFDPENKYLLHYSSESPSPQNFYSGNVVTDGSGYAWVQLPDYFEEINKNYKYQLTVVDDADSSGFVMAKVSKAIRGNRFQVRTSEPNATVSWRIEADRNDAYVRNRPTSDIELKEGREKGTYQHPEFFGQPKEKGMLYRTEHPETRLDPAPAVAKSKFGTRSAALTQR